MLVEAAAGVTGNLLNPVGGACSSHVLGHTTVEAYVQCRRYRPQSSPHECTLTDHLPSPSAPCGFGEERHFSKRPFRMRQAPLPTVGFGGIPACSDIRALAGARLRSGARDCLLVGRSKCTRRLSHLQPNTGSAVTVANLK